MSISSGIEGLRAKPEHIRKRYAFWSSLGATLVIFAFWLGSFSAFNNASTAPVAAAVEKAGSPGSYLIAGVGSFFNDLKELVFGAKRVTYSNIEVLPGK